MNTYTYIPDFMSAVADETFDTLWNGLAWVQRETTFEGGETVRVPRRECWMNGKGLEYTYGVGRGERTYSDAGFHPVVLDILNSLKNYGADLDCCFANGYRDGKDALGYHADDSIEMDDSRHIAVVTFGAVRRINFRPKGVGGPATDSLWLGNGSLLLMHPGMQDTHEHSIPKADRECGPRLSLTYRGLVM